MGDKLSGPLDLFALTFCKTYDEKYIYVLLYLTTIFVILWLRSLTNDDGNFRHVW